MPAPKWASDLLAQVWAAEAGAKAPANPPTLNWRTRRQKQWWSGQRPRYSTGRANLFGITITAGTSRQDQRLVLLHEIAHGLRHAEVLAGNAAGRGAGGHDTRYWEIAWHLYRRYRGNVPLRSILLREQDYKVGALQVAATLNIPGARATVALRTKPKEGQMASTTTATKPVATKPDVPAGYKLCPGIPGMGEAAHVAPLSDFAPNKAYPGGIYRQCRTHDAQYQKAWREKRKAAAQAEAGTEPAAGTPVQKRAAAVRNTKPAPEPEPEIVGETPAATAKRAATVARIEAVGPATPDGQALMKAAADEAAEARRAAWRASKAAQRAAAKAKAQA